MKYEVAEGADWLVEEEVRSLRVRTKEYALRIIRLYGSLPKSAEAQVFGKQLIRAGTSPGANDREASRSRSDSEFVAKIGICLQELDESDHWLESSADAEIVPVSQLSNLRDETHQRIAIFTSIAQKLKTQK